MNVYRDLCSPILEGLSNGVAVDIVVPNHSEADLQSVLEFGEEEEDDGRAPSSNGSVKRITDLDGCKAYAQLLAVTALVVELRAGKLCITSENVRATKS
jgi:hypothetical protein